jgi:hypothetical protein
VGKRSPILGYNHNVRYRGLVFHVQSEDSGVASPHLFTHLFHHGVIVSTRKLDYDAGSAEESIKSLMQAQHKAVLKDLRRGHFDDKIDSYLGGTPGLLPRGSDESIEPASQLAEASEPGYAGDTSESLRLGEPTGEIGLSPSQRTPISRVSRTLDGAVADFAHGPPTEQVLPMVLDDLSAPVIIIEDAPSPPPRPSATPPPTPPRPSAGPRSSITERAIGLARPPATPPPHDATLRVEAPTFDPASSDLEVLLDTDLQIDLDDGDAVTRAIPARRTTRDTETQLPFSEPAIGGRPTLDARPTLEISDSRPTLGMVNDEARRAAVLGESMPSALRSASPPIPPPPSDSRRLSDRPSNIHAAALPPARPIARPPARAAAVQPQVISRPAAQDDRNRRESEAVEVYSPAPPSAELPPGERPGQYAQHKRASGRIPLDGLRPERPTGVPVPAGLGRPPRVGSSPSAVPASHPVTAPSGPATPRESMRSVGQTEPIRGRTPTPSRISPQAGSPPQSRPVSAPSSGVVMTRPALIVGAPNKSASTVPRIRKAREDEGRGFGQGLISEKSLDEVILAYLSEDADEK